MVLLVILGKILDEKILDDRGADLVVVRFEETSIARGGLRLLLGGRRLMGLCE